MSLPLFAATSTSSTSTSTAPPPHVCNTVYNTTAFTVLLASVYCISTKQFSNIN